MPPGRGAGGEGRGTTNGPIDRSISNVESPATTLTPTLSQGESEPDKPEMPESVGAPPTEEQAVRSQASTMVSPVVGDQSEENLRRLFSKLTTDH
jgi:hypothetical protein